MRRAIVIGNSLGGLFAGGTLLRSGWVVTVVERSTGRLVGRGAGLGVHPPMLQGLLAAGGEVDGSIGIAVGGRTAFNRDECIAAEFRMPQFSTSWHGSTRSFGRLPRRVCPSRDHHQPLRPRP